MFSINKFLAIVVLSSIGFSNISSSGWLGVSPLEEEVDTKPMYAIGSKACPSGYIELGKGSQLGGPARLDRPLVLYCINKRKALTAAEFALESDAL
ncbi:hypothetical protein A3F66_02480 [candidate division TM6 bacterium RIFCSPHIGHO2_12_FULL_32_22]|nr:MAG: hypothetical protein A3F66_02480 [candidate division TM6 bacterium RIFCSPHIGHO2_12_FULL_32_22]